MNKNVDAALYGLVIDDDELPLSHAVDLLEKAGFCTTFSARVFNTALCAASIFRFSAVIAASSARTIGSSSAFGFMRAV